MKNSKWILLAEDDALVAELTKLAFEPAELKCELVIARDGLEALDIINQREGGCRPVFVLLDLKMPKMDGLEVLRQIKSDVLLKTIPVIMFSSSRETNDVARCYQLGANAYVVKPVGFQHFSAAIKRMVAFWAELNESPPHNAKIAEPTIQSPARPAAAPMDTAVAA